MARSFWSGAISFGLVNVPVKLFTAQSPKDIHFHMLHDKDGVRIKQKRVCPVDDEEVPYEHIVKGFEISPDRYVLIKPEELTALNPKASRTIDIDAFIDLHQIDPIYFDKSYYLVPDKGAGKAYSLLLKAMQEANKVALAKVVIRTKGYLVALRPTGNALSMSTLLYQDEVVQQNEMEGLPVSVETNERELAMAKQLIESLATDFHPEKYSDEYREQVLDLIERKAEGEEIVAQPAEKEPTKVINLMAALEASLAKAKEREEGGPPIRATPAHEKETEAAAPRKTARKRKSASA
jgi:DNA end-binding protein Ku